MRLRRSFGLSLLHRYLALAISFGTTMLISRLLSPAEVGIYLMGAAILLISGPLSKLGIGVYLIQERELTPHRIGTAFTLLLLSSLSITALLILFRHEVAAFYGEPAIAEVLLVAAACFVVVSVTTAGTSLLQRDLRFDVLLSIGICGSLVYAATAVSLAWHGYSYMSLAWAVLAEQVALAAMHLSIWPRVARTRLRFSEWRRVLGIGGVLTLSNFVAELGNGVPQLALGRAAGFDAAGLFQRSRSVTDLVWKGLLDGVLPVLLPAIAAYSRDGVPLQGPVLLAFTHLAALIWSFFAVIAILASDVVRVLFGEQWDQATPVLRILCLIGATTPLTAVVPELLAATGRASLNLKLSVICHTVRIILVLIAAPYGMEAVAWALVAGEWFNGAVSLAVVTRLTAVTMADFLPPIFQGVAVTLAAAAGPLLLLLGQDRTEHPELLRLAIAMPLAAAGWLAGIYLARHPLRGEVAAIMARR